MLRASMSSGRLGFRPPPWITTRWKTESPLVDKAARFVHGVPEFSVDARSSQMINGIRNWT